MPSDHKRFVASLTVPNRVESIRLAATFLVHAASAFRVPGAAGGMFEVAVVEALNNTLKHGTRDPNACIVCDFEIYGGRPGSAEGRCLKIRVLDDAAGGPLELALPAAGVPLPEWTADQWAGIPESGYGLHLIAAVFPSLRAVSRGGHHGIEMELNF
jgi:anti-sigma regulatory factor (Ser/Thr protein kinase)